MGVHNDAGPSLSFRSHSRSISAVAILRTRATTTVPTGSTKTCSFVMVSFCFGVSHAHLNPVCAAQEFRVRSRSCKKEPYQVEGARLCGPGGAELFRCGQWSASRISPG